MSNGKSVITASGYDELKRELEELTVNKRKEVAQKIKEAREQGDLSENAEYDAAKEEQAEIESRISQIETILNNVDEVVDDEDVDINVVSVGTKVKVFDVEFDEEVVYQIVGSSEADFLENKISNESPLGSALLGKKVGAKVKYSINDSTMAVKILEISK